MGSLLSFDVQAALLTTCYAAGLRISDAVRLTIPAIDSQRMVLRVAQGKGHQDRYVMLSPKRKASITGISIDAWPNRLRCYSGTSNRLNVI